MLGHEAVEQRRRPPRSSPRRSRGVTSVPAVALGQRHHADRQRHPGLDLAAAAGRAACGGERPSRTSSEEPPPMSNRITPSACGSTSGVQPVAASLASVSRSTISSSSPDLLGDAGAEFGAVDRGAAGLGGDQARAGDAAVAHLVAADGQRLDRARDRGVADAAGRRDALAQPDDAGERVDDAEAVAGRARDQQPAIVGAEIERGIGRTRTSGPPCPPVVTRVAIGRPPTPPETAAAAADHARGRGRRLPGPRRFIQCLPAAPKPFQLDGGGDVQSQYRRECNSGQPRATDAR